MRRGPSDANPLAQVEPQRRATRRGLAVRGTFSPAGPWRPAVGARLARTLGVMKTPLALRFTKLELGFLLAALLVLGIGTWASIVLRDAGWMPGVGALIIVMGVVFALWDLRNLLALKADQFAQLRKEFVIAQRIYDVEEKEHRMPSTHERKSIRAEVDQVLDQRLPSSAPIIRKRFHAVEVFIVCLGTLVNGFGQKVVEWWLP